MGTERFRRGNRDLGLKPLLLVLALCLAQVSLLSFEAEGTSASPDPGCVAHWRFDEGSGNIAHDETANNNDGTIYGATWVYWVSGKALSFDGINDYVEVPHNSSLNFDVFTWAAWIKVDDMSASRPIIGEKWDSGTWPHWFVTVESTSKLSFLTMTSSRLVRLFGDTVLSAGTWYHVAGTYDGSKMKIYVNGVEDENSASQSGTLIKADRPLGFGRSFESGFDSFFDGLMDEVRIYNRALSSDEIEALYLENLRVSAIIDIHPETLNLESRGRWITCLIKLPEGYDVADIDIGSIRLNGVVPAEEWSPTIGDHDHKGISHLMVKFSRLAVQAIISVGEVELTVTGLVNSTPFEGKDTIRVIKPGKGLTDLAITSPATMLALTNTAEAQESWTGAATFGLENLYAVSLDADLWLGEGSKLVVKFYNYADSYQDESIVWSGATPDNVSFSKTVPHPLGQGTQKAKLDLTADNTENVISTIATFTVTRDDLHNLNFRIYMWWPFCPPENRHELFAMIAAKYLQWPFAPT